MQFAATLIAALVAGFAAQAAGLPFPAVAVIAVGAGIAADALVRRRMQR